MPPTFTVINDIESLNGEKIDIRKSNEKSPIIDIIKTILTDPIKERYFDFLINDLESLKLMTNPIIDMGRTDTNPLLYFFSSNLERDPEDGKSTRLEHSNQCKYKLNPEIRNLSQIFQSFQQMLLSGTIQTLPPDHLKLLQEKSRDLLFQTNALYGYSINDQLTKAFIDKNKLISLSKISHIKYENIIDEFIRIGIGVVFQQICWCKKCITQPYVILIHGQNEIPDSIKCPICTQMLYSGRFVYLTPDFESLLENQGGYLPPLISWYLTKENYEWTADIVIDKSEYGDIILKFNNKYYLIECKIWSRNKTDRGLKSNIEKAIEQAMKHTIFWEEKNIEIEKTIILTNQLDDSKFQQFIDEAVANKTSLIDTRIIKIYPLKHIPTLVSEIIGK